MPSDGSTLNLAVDKSGIVVFRDYTRVGCFHWEELSNIEQRERKFRLKFHDGKTVKFYFDHGKVCQDFFRVCVEKHREVHSEC
jgi:hypothetical protein